METGVALAKRTTDRASSLEASLVSAEVNSRAGKSDAAIKTLQPILSEADREGNVGFSFEARLALGKMNFTRTPPWDASTCSNLWKMLARKISGSSLAKRVQNWLGSLRG